jgi:thiamine-phosphate diphosphorylase
MFRKGERVMPGRGGLYVVTGEEFSAGRPYIEVIKACIAGGAGIIQLREKSWDGARLIELGRELRKLTLEAGVLFIVNDRVDIAMAVEAEGVHIGQEDIPLPLMRKIAGPRMIIGVSAHNPAEAAAAEKEGAAYIGFGPVFPTETKKDTRPARGPEMLEKVRKATSLPIYAIGGIKVENTASVIRAGADGVAVISGVIGADDITGAARNFVLEVNKAKR